MLTVLTIETTNLFKLWYTVITVLHQHLTIGGLSADCQLIQLLSYLSYLFRLRFLSEAFVSKFSKC